MFTKIGEVLAAQKKVRSDSVSKLREQSECPENTVFKHLSSLRMLKGAGCQEVYTNLFETSSACQVFKVGASSKP